MGRVRFLYLTRVVRSAAAGRRPKGLDQEPTGRLSRREAFFGEAWGESVFNRVASCNPLPGRKKTHAFIKRGRHARTQDFCTQKSFLIPGVQILLRHPCVFCCPFNCSCDVNILCVTTLDERTDKKRTRLFEHVSLRATWNCSVDSCGFTVKRIGYKTGDSACGSFGFTSNRFKISGTYCGSSGFTSRRFQSTGTYCVKSAFTAGRYWFFDSPFDYGGKHVIHESVLAICDIGAVGFALFPAGASTSSLVGLRHFQSWYFKFEGPVLG